MSSKSDFEARQQRAFRRLGTDNPICVGCGHTDWRCVELHHIAGQKYHDDLAIVCRNCHRVLSDAQCDHPPPDDPDSTIGRYLLGLADLFAMIGERLQELGRILIASGEDNPPANGDAS